MDQDTAEQHYKAHVAVLPYHGQGHINPMLQFSKRLAAKGIKVTVVTTLSNTKSLQAVTSSSHNSITFESIYDDCPQGGVAGPGGFKGFLDRFEAVGSRNLIELITKSHQGVKCLVYDANIPWASNVAAELGIARAAFFTQSCAYVASMYPMYCKWLGVPPLVPFLSMPGLPEIRFPNLPSLGAETAGEYSPIIKFILRQFDNSKTADWVLFNSFHMLEEEVINWMSGLWPVKSIGPTLPSVYLDNRVKDDDNYGFNTHIPNTEACMKWLDSKETGSVIYVSFGSVASLTTQQTNEVAKALVQSNKSFMWVVRQSETSKLPTNFAEENSDKGLVVQWCPQLAVLAHIAIGCFISHCGWNSTMEAISMGVPVIGMPQFMDQTTNAHFVEHVWEAGIVPETNGIDSSLSDEICRCIEEIFGGERGGKIKKNVARWKALAKDAVSEGGTSDKCIDEIILSMQ